MFLTLRKKMYVWLRSGYERAPETESNNVKEHLVSLSANRKKYSPSNTIKGSDRSYQDDTLDSEGMHFKLIPAAGGIAVEVSYYNDKVGNTEYKLYVIPEDAELSKELANIITLQALRR